MLSDLSQFPYRTFCIIYPECLPTMLPLYCYIPPWSQLLSMPYLTLLILSMQLAFMLLLSLGKVSILFNTPRFLVTSLFQFHLPAIILTLLLLSDFLSFYRERNQDESYTLWHKFEFWHNDRIWSTKDVKNRATSDWLNFKRLASIATETQKDETMP